uniref:Tubulin-specific chaperone C n=1 Tax=Cacopsylla melanoneura TaxID=428564 RepID=A0A8D8Q2W8_9HEMI
MGDQIDKASFGEVNIPEKLLKRDQERQIAMGKRQEERGGREGDGFSDTFNEHYNQIKIIISEMEEGTNDNKEKLIERFADVSKQLLLLNHTIIDAKIFLPSYDMKMYNNKLQDLTEHANVLEAKLLPRKKFGFKKADKVKPTSGEGDKIEETVKDVKNKDAVDFVKKSYGYETKDIGFRDKNNETLELSGEDVNKKPISLSNIDSCTIKVNGNASTVHMNNIRNSTIYLGPVSNSVFIDTCTDSTLYFACHQMRMHTSVNTCVYLHVTSRPIIENCKGIGFAPVVDIDSELFQMSGLDANKNHWNEVDDFNWLSVEEKSPNWFVIQDNDQKPIKHQT